jgi:segregation and condensation protein B
VSTEEEILGQEEGNLPDGEIIAQDVAAPASAATSVTAVDLNVPADIKRVLEVALFASAVPLPVSALRQLFGQDPGPEIVRRLLDELRADWETAGRGIELAQTANGWRFQTRAEFQPYLDNLKNEKPPRYSRAVMETLAIIAYRQPVTRGGIEEIRGVAVSPNVLKTLESRGWIDVVGHRDTPGRPALFATTKRFLDDMGLRSLTELPALPEIERMMELVDTTDIEADAPAPAE